MKKRFWICIVLYSISFVSCVSTINHSDMQLVTKNNSQQILNLAYYGEKFYGDKVYDENDDSIVRQNERLMKNGFLDTSSEEFGYYYIICRYAPPENKGLSNIPVIFFDAAEDFFTEVRGSLYVCIVMPIAIPIALPWGLIQTTLGIGSTALGVLIYAAAPPIMLLGIPYETAHFQIQASLYIFDSEGKMVSRFIETGSFSQTAGLYYGHNPTRNAAAAFSKLFEEIFQTASMKSDEINHVLRAAGPITEKNREQAIENIKTFLNTSRVNPSGSGYSYIPL